MKRITVLIVALSVVLGACASAKKKKSNAATTKATTAAQSTSASGTASNTKPAVTIEYMRVYNSACFGRCPVYAIEYFKNGNVSYSGYMNVEKAGQYEKNFGTAYTQEIFNRFHEHRIDTCAEHYEVRIADLPGLIYEIKYTSGRLQTIQNAHAGPPYLSAFSGETRDLAEHIDASWKKVADTAREYRLLKNEK